MVLSPSPIATEVVPLPTSILGKAERHMPVSSPVGGQVVLGLGDFLTAWSCGRGTLHVS